MKIALIFTIFVSVTSYAAHNHCSGSPSNSSQFNQNVEAYVTRPDLREFLKPSAQTLISFPHHQSTDQMVIDLHETPSCQQMSGFGFAMTESTVLNLNNLESHLKDEAMKALFDKVEGAGLNYVIVPLTSTDFNDPKMGDFSVCDCLPGQTNKTGCFNPSRLHPTLKILKEAQQLNPQLQLMLKPWTVPPHMKYSGSVKNSNPYFGGAYDPKWTPTYAKCLARSVKYFEQKGLKVKSISAQNEPGLDLPYPSTYMDDNDHANLLNELDKRLRTQGLQTQLIVRADNFISAPSVETVMQKLRPQKNRPAFAAHCYTNDPETPKMLLKNGQQRFCSTNKNRELEYLMGECTASARPDYNGDFNWWMENRVMGDMDMGATAVLAWNGLLDKNYGPKNNGCTQCRGLLEVDSFAGRSEIFKNPEYYAIAQISSFIEPGALRLILPDGQIGFKNPDGTVVLLLKNKKSSAQRFLFKTEGCKFIDVDVPAFATMTVKLPRE